MDYGKLLLLLLRGTGTTVLSFLIIIVTAIPLGLIIMLVLRSKITPFRWLANAYVFVMRGTPLLLQIFFIYFGVPFIPVIGQYIAIQDRFVAALVAFILNYAAYFAEIFRGGLLAVDIGQHEAAKVLGLNRFQTMWRIIFPQMVRVSLPAVCNEGMILIKDTALLYSVGVLDLLETAKEQVNLTASVTPYLFAAVIYLILNTGLTFLFKKLEKKYSYEMK